MSEESQLTGDQISSDADSPSVEMADSNQGNEEMGQRQVPLEALESERAKRQQREDELRMMRENMALLMAQQQPKQKAEEDFSGLSDDDVLTVKEFKQWFGKEKQQMQMSLQELRMTQKYPDYEEVVTKYLPEVLKENPGLRNTLQESNDYELAYFLAKKSDQYQSSHKKQKRNADAERIVQNANRAGSLSSVGQTSPINEAKRYRDMSDAEFRQLANRNLGHF